MNSDLDLSISELAGFLEQRGETLWSKKARMAIERSDSNAKVVEVQSWFGGMGSLNDLILCEMNGHNVELNEYDAVNDQLERLRTDLLTSVARVLERTEDG